MLAHLPDILFSTYVVVWTPDPAESASGDGDLIVASRPAHVEFAASYPSTSATRPTGSLHYQDAAAGINFASRDFDFFAFNRIDGAEATPDEIVLGGRGKNRADRDCTFFFQARGPLPPDYDAGARSGAARIRIECGDSVYDTDPVFISRLTPFSSGSVHLVYPPASP